VRRLHHAILATKGFSYKGAPVPQGAPVGLVAIYHPHFQKSLSVHTFDADHAPAHVVFSKDSN
jgi:hypothetical protein